MSTPKTEVRLERQPPTLRLSGRLDAAGVAGLAIGRSDCEGVETIDIAAVEHLDSTGVALVAELVSRCEKRSGRRPAVAGQPPGLQELCRAYRISADFSDFP